MNNLDPVLPVAQDDIDDLAVLVTAEEAFPVLEQAFLDARMTISGSFRIFDLSTRLHSARARAIGRTWADLFVDTLNRGVAIRLIVSDFDPIAAPDLHRLAWRSHRQLEEVRQRARDGAELDVTVALHRAEAGLFPRLTFQPIVRHKLAKAQRMRQRMDPEELKVFDQETPGLQHHLRRGAFHIAPIHPATHHQKMAVFDSQKVYIGGLDLNERRYDSKDHDRPAHETWHDVQVMATGRVVKAAEAHLDTFLKVIDGAMPPSRAAPGFLRTLSRRRHRAPLSLSPKTLVREIEQGHLKAISAARHLLYLETQFFRHVPLAKALARRARACPTLKVILLLPAAPEEVAFSSRVGLDARFGEHQQVRCLSILRRAFGPERLLVVSPAQPVSQDSDDRDTLRSAPLVYVHSKVSIFDTDSAIVSSANLNGRSLRWDTETGLHLTRADHVEQLRRRVMGNWLPADAGDRFLDLDTAFDAWRALARANGAARPEARRGFIVPYDPEAARETAQPVPGLPGELV